MNKQPNKKGGGTSSVQKKGSFQMDASITTVSAADAAIKEVKSKWHGYVQAMSTYSSMIEQGQLPWAVDNSEWKDFPWEE
eukprot:5174846-Amphidinium_carterae.2